jgi:hypothetical protein
MRFVMLLVTALAAGCGDGTGPSDGAEGIWSAASGRYRLVYMSGAQPPWRYVDPAGSISSDVDSAMMYLHPDGRYTMEFYLSPSMARPTFRGYWSPDGGQLAFLYLPHGKGGLTSGAASAHELTISPVSPLMPGIEFPNGYQTDFDFKRVGNDREVVDSFVQNRLLTGLTLTGVVMSDDDMVLAVAPLERKLVRSRVPFQVPAASSPAGAQALDIAIAPGGTEAFLANGDAGEVGIYAVATGARTGSVKLPGIVLRVWSGGSAIFALTFQPPTVDSLLRIDAVTHAVTARVAIHGGSVAVSNDGSRVYAGADTGGIQELDGATLEPLRVLDIPATGGVMALSEDAATLFIGRDGDKIEGWDLATGMQTLNVAVTGDIHDIASQPGTGMLYVSREQFTGGGSVYRINPLDPADVSVYNTGGLPSRIAFTASGAPLVANGFGWIDMLR